MPITQTLSDIDARPTWRSLYERDLDLIILDLLYSSSAFRAWLLEAVAPDLGAKGQDCRFAGAWHSVIDELGHESDIEAEWHLPDGGRFTVLVEDKIDARCQPDQAVRYLKRARGYLASGRSARARTLLIAPATYPRRYREDTDAFEAHLPIERIAEWCEREIVGGRGEYLAGMLRHALRRWGGAGAEDGTGGKPTYSEIYAIVREELAAGFPDLEVSNPKPSEWVYFQFAGREPGVSIRYRLPDHWAELVLKRNRVEAEALLSAHATAPLAGAEITGRGHSELVVWIPTPELDLSAEAKSQRGHIRAALATVDALREWYLRHAATLHGR